MLRSVARNLAFVPVVGVAVHDQVGTLRRVGGASMEPTLEARDWVLVDRGFGNRAASWGRNAVVLVRSPEDRRRLVLTRLRHFEGEYVRVRTAGFNKLIVVPRGHCWMEGDSADDEDAADDSRALGPLPFALVEGRVRAVLWPPARARWGLADDDDDDDQAA